MLYETLNCPQIAPFCISSKIFMACTLLSLIYAPEYTGPELKPTYVLNKINLSAPIPSTSIMKIITASLMPRLNIIVKCLTLNSEFNFQSGQTSYIKII
jgi:hypothetical protein